MYAILGILAFVPLAAFFASRRWSEEKIAWEQTAGWTLAMFCLGLFSASPFVTSRGVGTGEAYNYSLALADAVTQLRAGELPLVGQSEYAFNGRVHPLRNAPYQFYLAAFFSFASFHQLNFWQLQNLCLAFSLVGTVFSAYAALRWGVGCRRSTAFLLGSTYALCPGLLGACTGNLFMTVHAALFVPIAVGACVRSSRKPGAVNDLVLAASVAATWLAHPPVAAWLTVGVVIIRLFILVRFHRWRNFVALFFAAVAGLGLASYVFVSVSTLSEDLGFFNGAQSTLQSYIDAVMANLRAAFPAAILPVSHLATSLGDLQFGYGSWLLLLGTSAGLFLTKKPYRNFQGATAALMVLVTISFLLLLLPVPNLTLWLWHHVPAAVSVLTNVWPMQRIYLTATALTIFSAALMISNVPQHSRLITGALVIIVGWSAFESSKFIRRGYAMMWSSDMTSHAHVLSNIDLTITSYAFLTVPSTFMHGAMDPLFEFSIVDKEGKLLSSPLQTALANGTEIATGKVFYANPSGIQRIEQSQKIILRPGLRYTLNFDFKIAPAAGTLDIIGAKLRRHYLLPSAGETHAFGMGPSNRHALTLWTPSTEPEEIEIRFYITDWKTNSSPLDFLADFSVREIDPAKLPVRLESLFPLRLAVDAPTDNGILTTPRNFLRGYTATVNGRALHTSRGKDGEVTLPIPKGLSRVEISYRGQTILYVAFGVTAAAWILFCFFLITHHAGVRWNRLIASSSQFARRSMRWMGEHAIATSVMLGVIALVSLSALALEKYVAAAGPIRLTVLLPVKPKGLNDPLVTSGRTGAGTNVFITYLDSTHVRIGADVWGKLFLSEPIQTDYAQEHELIVNSSALYPHQHPLLDHFSTREINRLQNDFRVKFDGRPVITETINAYDSAIDEIKLGENSIQSSSSGEKFQGTITSVRRLPLPRVLGLLPGEGIAMQLRTPSDRTGYTEAIAAIGKNGKDGVLALTYLPRNRLRFSWFNAVGAELMSRDVLSLGDKLLQFELRYSEKNGKVFCQLTLDARPLLSFPIDSLAAEPFLVSVGSAPNSVAQISSEFTGRNLTAQKISSAEQALKHIGPVKLLVAFPQDRMGRTEPLLTTGHTGRGDFAYVVYVDRQHVAFGLDHWGREGAISAPIAIDYGSLHTVEISQGALFPEAANDAAWDNVSSTDREKFKRSMSIQLDGKLILEAQLEAYPSPQNQITPAKNRIGGSNNEPEFTGDIFSIQRTGFAQRHIISPDP